jgi:hypothetical protein
MTKEKEKAPAIRSIEQHVTQFVNAILSDLKEIGVDPGSGKWPEFLAAFKVAVKSAYVSERLTGYLQAAEIAKRFPLHLYRAAKPGTVHMMISTGIIQGARKALMLPKPEREEDGASETRGSGMDLPPSGQTPSEGA